MDALGMYKVPIVTANYYECDYGANPLAYYLPCSSVCTNDYVLNPSPKCSYPENILTEVELDKSLNLDATPQIFKSATPNISYTDSSPECILPKDEKPNLISNALIGGEMDGTESPPVRIPDNLSISSDSSDVSSVSSTSESEKLIEENANKILHNLRRKNVNRVIIGTLNINTIENKLDQLQVIIDNSVDILTIQETKFSLIENVRCVFHIRDPHNYVRFWRPFG